MNKEKMKNFWQKHRFVIGCAVGVAVVATTIYVVKKGQSVPGSHTWVPMKNPDFPREMPVKEIKEALSKVEGTVLYDALISVKDGVSSLFVRSST